MKNVCRHFLISFYVKDTREKLFLFLTEFYYYLKITRVIGISGI